MSRTTKTTTRVDKEKGDGNKSLVKAFLGKDIMVTLRSEYKLNGRLESVSQYELLLTVSHSPVLIMKHAVDYIELSDVPEESA